MSTDKDVDLAAYGLLDIPMSDKAGIDFLDKLVQARDARIEVLVAAIRKADGFLTSGSIFNDHKEPDPIAAHITLVEALGSSEETPR
jgi:hypothetical protein